jgi:putative endonuclease
LQIRHPDRREGSSLKQFCIYILTNKSKTLYTGVTSNLEKRIYEHKNKLVKGFTEKYKIDRLVYYEVAENAASAIEREKQIKGWIRKKKLDLIIAFNPEWKDLSIELFHY